MSYSKYRSWENSAFDSSEFERNRQAVMGCHPAPKPELIDYSKLPVAEWPPAEKLAEAFRRAALRPALAEPLRIFLDPTAMWVLCAFVSALAVIMWTAPVTVPVIVGFLVCGGIVSSSYEITAVVESVLNFLSVAVRAKSHDDIERAVPYLEQVVESGATALIEIVLMAVLKISGRGLNRLSAATRRTINKVDQQVQYQFLEGENIVASGGGRSIGMSGSSAITSARSEAKAAMRTRAKQLWGKSGVDPKKVDATFPLNPSEKMTDQTRKALAMQSRSYEVAKTGADAYYSALKGKTPVRGVFVNNRTTTIHARSWQPPTASSLSDPSLGKQTEFWSLPEHWTEARIHGSKGSTHFAMDKKTSLFGPKGQTEKSVRQFANDLRLSGYNGGPIRLDSCSSGARTDEIDSLAQQLADELRAPVVAPTRILRTPTRDLVTSATHNADNRGIWRLFLPRTEAEIKAAKAASEARKSAVDDELMALLEGLGG